MTKVDFAGQIIVLGLGSIASGALPILCEHVNISPSRVQVISKSTDYLHCARDLGVKYTELGLTIDNYVDVLQNRFGLSTDDFVVNLSVDVSSNSLIELCHEIGALYIDMCIDPWVGWYDTSLSSLSHRSNYGLRHDVRSEIGKLAGGATALIAHGANPGLVNHFVKRALMELCEIET
jgi:homospermidine synthase